ncbi:MAG: InlB B-repeat-containing protein [Bacilli bacterium]|nr:InlB B-repeat-containing protein [Bacilli bacterium]
MKKVLSLTLIMLLSISGMFVLAGCKNDYTTSVASETKKMCLLRINADGPGQVAYAKEAGDIVFNSSRPVQSTFTNVEDGSKIIISAKPEEGETFAKWTRDGNEFSRESQIEVTVTSDVEYIAVFGTDSSVKVTFDYNLEDEQLEEVEEKVGQGSTVEEFNAEREGCILEGWYLDEDCTQKFDFSTKITDNIRLYAKWVEI